MPAWLLFLKAVTAHAAGTWAGHHEYLQCRRAAAPKGNAAAAHAQVVEWTPQNDLLGDGRVRAFVTHGGLNSIYEARPHPKPPLCIMPCVCPTTAPQTVPCICPPPSQPRMHCCALDSSVGDTGSA